MIPNVGESTYFFFAFCWMGGEILLFMQLPSVILTFLFTRVSLQEFSSTWLAFREAYRLFLLQK